MNSDDFINLAVVFCLIAIAVSTVCIAIYLEDAATAINETNENCVEVNKEIYCKE